MKPFTQRHHVLVSYDIADDGRRNEVFETCKDFGNHVQYSVFPCELNSKERIQLRERLRGQIDHGADQILLIDLGAAHRSMLEQMDVLGQPYAPPGRQFVV